MKILPRIIIICGPTATGKSALAVKLARRFVGEIISADSRQVYKGLNIGAGKITRSEMKGVPHHLLDIQSPKTRLSVEKYKKLAQKKISDILRRGKLPIICGGTGFYIQTVVDNVSFPEVPPNDKLRTRLSKKTAVELFAMLRAIDPRRASNIDPKNSRRLIRAIEIAQVLGRVPNLEVPPPSWDSLWIGVDLPDKKLKEKITIRLFARIREGMIEEAKNLHKGGLSWKRMNELGLEYRYLALFLQKKITRVKFLEKLGTEIWHYAKRQRTWFRRDKRIKWFNPTEENEIFSLTKKNPYPTGLACGVGRPGREACGVNETRKDRARRKTSSAACPSQ